MVGKNRPSRKAKHDKRREEYRIRKGFILADDVSATGGETLAPPATNEHNKVSITAKHGPDLPPSSASLYKPDVPDPSVTDADKNKFMVSFPTSVL